MRFYVIESDDGETVGCERSLKAAKVAAEKFFNEGDYTITGEDVAVSAETVRRLLGNLGGYALAVWQAHPRPLQPDN